MDNSFLYARDASGAEYTSDRFCLYAKSKTHPAAEHLTDDFCICAKNEKHPTAESLRLFLPIQRINYTLATLIFQADA